VAKGRSSSRPLNALVRRVAALCFAGGLVLHCVFISTKHNPADWPSRGDATTWPTALRRRAYKNPLKSRCPGCGVLPMDHPQRLPRKSRGQPASIYNCCDGPSGGYAFDFDTGKWRPFYRLYVERANSFSDPHPAWRRAMDDLSGSDSDL
jgi:hypothetical protein